MGSTHGMYGTWSANLEVERTIKKAELTAFLCLLTRIVGPTTAHVGNKRIIDGLRRGEMKCIDPTAKNVDVWILIGIRGAQSSSRKKTTGGRACRGASHKEQKNDMSLSERVLSRKARKGWMKKQNMERCWMKKALWRDQVPRTSAKGCTPPCKMQQAIAGGKVTPL